MPRRATRMPLDLSADPAFNLTVPMQQGPTGLDQVQNILRQYERDNYSAFVRGLEPPRTPDILDIANGAALNTATLTRQQIEEMQQAVITANERAVRLQRDAEARRVAEGVRDLERQRLEVRRHEPSWRAEVEASLPSTVWGHPVRYVERERVQPRRHTALITMPRSALAAVMRELNFQNSVGLSHTSTNPDSIWGIPVRISNTDVLSMPIMEVTDGIRNVAMQFPIHVLTDPGQLSEFHRELSKRLDWEHERDGDQQLSSKALPYGFHSGRKVNRKSKVRSLVYEKED